MLIVMGFCIYVRQRLNVPQKLISFLVSVKEKMLGGVLKPQRSMYESLWIPMAYQSGLISLSQSSVNTELLYSLNWTHLLHIGIYTDGIKLTELIKLQLYCILMNLNITLLIKLDLFWTYTYQFKFTLLINQLWCNEQNVFSNNVEFKHLLI